MIILVLSFFTIWVVYVYTRFHGSSSWSQSLCLIMIHFGPAKSELIVGAMIPWEIKIHNIGKIHLYLKKNSCRLLNESINKKVSYFALDSLFIHLNTVVVNNCGFLTAIYLINACWGIVWDYYGNSILKKGWFDCCPSPFRKTKLLYVYPY